MALTKYRVGAHWGTTIIEIDLIETPDAEGRRPSDRLVALAQTPEDAARMVRLLNTGMERA